MIWLHPNSSNTITTSTILWLSMHQARSTNPHFWKIDVDLKMGVKAKIAPHAHQELRWTLGEGKQVTVPNTVLSYMSIIA